ncbi:hypothetical protein PR002_g13652 [Phytophthora rubi]|uniref:Uncharacterized protein n=2 Tax=Phytophthora rubi TaxID=129364 RepID=A0A6A3LDL6_9STRA|nr:hypothetical protein PR002_g13652 [Phytophthora rubi]
MVSHVLRPLRAFAPSYFDDIFVHSRAEDGLSAVDVHLRHLRKVFEKMRENKLYANLKKCVFCAPEIPVLGCYVSKSGVRADPEKISSICSWPTPKNQTELRQWLGLANYLHKYTKDYAGLIQPMSSLLKKDVAWNWRPEHQDAFDAVKKSLASAPVLMLPDTSRPFHVACNCSWTCYPTLHECPTSQIARRISDSDARRHDISAAPVDRSTRRGNAHGAGKHKPGQSW